MKEGRRKHVTDDRGAAQRSAKEMRLASFSSSVMYVLDVAHRLLGGVRDDGNRRPGRERVADILVCVNRIAPISYALFDVGFSLSGGVGTADSGISGQMSFILFIERRGQKNKELNFVVSRHKHTSSWPYSTE